MAREAIFGEYKAYLTKNGIRFMKNGKLVSKKTMPPEVVEYLSKQVGLDTKVYEDSPAQHEDSPAQDLSRPTPEQIEQMKKESMEVPAHLQRTPEEMEARMEAESLSAQDFETPPEETNHTPEEPSDYVSDFMETVSIHTADISDIARALYDRFGIYTVYLKELPRQDEINPLTGEAFTKYHLGIAYQAALRAQNVGIQTPDKKSIDTQRHAEKHFQEVFEPVPHTMAQAQQSNSFKYRTSPEGTRRAAATKIVHVLQPDGTYRAEQVEVPIEEQRKNNAVSRPTNDQFTDEPLVEPNFGQKVVRPNW